MNKPIANAPVKGKKDDKITIEQVLRSRDGQDDHPYPSKGSIKSKDKYPFDYTKPDQEQASSSNYAKRAKSKDREAKNRSYVGVEKRRYPSSRKEEIKKMHSTSFGTPFYDSTHMRYNYEKDTKRQIDVEAFRDPRILNVVSPKEKVGFHITDLLETKRSVKKTPKLNDSDIGNQSMFDGFSIKDDKLNQSLPMSNLAQTADRYMIKNFRIVNVNSGKQSERSSKPVTAARMQYNDSGARTIKKITGGESSQKVRFNSTSNVFRGNRTPLEMPVSNSLLNPNEKEQYTDMRPIHNYFDQLYEETHYMFPKHKSKFGLNTSYNAPFTGYRSQSRSKKSNALNQFEDKQQVPKGELEESMINTIKEDALKEEQKDTPAKGELEFLLEKSLKYQKDKLSKKGTPVESLSDEDKLNIIMNTWLTSDKNDPAFAQDVAETQARMTSHMIINTRNNKSIYPDEIKDAEIDIYLRNRKNVPKYELMQYMKFTSNKETDEKTKDSSSVKEDSESKDNGYDLNVG